LRRCPEEEEDEDVSEMREMGGWGFVYIVLVVTPFSALFFLLSSSLNQSISTLKKKKDR